MLMPYAWKWASISPGMRHLPCRSICRATLDLTVPTVTSAIRPFSMTTVAPSWSSGEVPSNSRALWKIVTVFAGSGDMHASPPRLSPAVGSLRGMALSLEHALVHAARHDRRAIRADELFGRVCWVSKFAGKLRLDHLLVLR